MDLFEWRGSETPRITASHDTYEGMVMIKRETLPDGRVKMILTDRASGDFADVLIAGE